MTLTEEQIAEIRARVEAATLGPWRQEGPRVYFGFEGGISLHAAPNPINNSHFIAHARTDIPALLSALEAANKRADEAEGGRTVRQERIEKLEARLLDVLAANKRVDEAGARRKCYECGSEMTACARCNPELPTAELTALRARVAELEDCRNTLLDALEDLRQWADSYPLNIFPEPDFARAAKALADAGMTIDAISASNMRHVLYRVKTIADAALKGASHEQGSRCQ